MSSVEFHKFRENIKNINDYTDQKEKIFDNFIDQGLPNKRNESWKYFDLVSKSKKYIKNDISNSEIIVEDLEEKNLPQRTPGLIIESAPIERIKKLDLLIKRQYK